MAYNIGSDQLGQQGSGFVDTTGAFTPPSGMVIVAITAIGEYDTTVALDALVADTSNYGVSDGSTGTAYFGSASAVTANGGGADDFAATNLIPSGVTIYGRWTSLTLTGAETAGGLICYFGK